MPVSRSAFIWSQTSAACGFAAAACRASSKIGAVRLPVLLGESGDGGADVRAGERGALVDRAGEEALAERAVEDEADAELLQGGQDLGLGPSPPQRVLALHGGDGLHGVAAADGAGGSLGHAEVPDLAAWMSSWAAPATSSIGMPGFTRCW